jgi:hypothetical protein
MMAASCFRRLKFGTSLTFEATELNHSTALSTVIISVPSFRHFNAYRYFIPDLGLRATYLRRT